MKTLLFLFLLTLASITHAEQQSVEGYYQKAIQLRDSGDLIAASECVAQGIALNTHDPEWLPKSELLSAELYIALDRLDSADITARQIQQLYPDTDFATQATALREKIAQLTAKAEETQ